MSSKFNFSSDEFVIKVKLLNNFLRKLEDFCLYNNVDLIIYGNVQFSNVADFIKFNYESIMSLSCEDLEKFSLSPFEILGIKLYKEV